MAATFEEQLQIKAQSTAAARTRLLRLRAGLGTEVAEVMARRMRTSRAAAARADRSFFSVLHIDGISQTRRVASTQVSATPMTVSKPVAPAPAPAPAAQAAPAAHAPMAAPAARQPSAAAEAAAHDAPGARLPAVPEQEESTCYLDRKSLLAFRFAVPDDVPPPELESPHGFKVAVPPNPSAAPGTFTRQRSDRSDSPKEEQQQRPSLKRVPPSMDSICSDSTATPTPQHGGVRGSMFSPTEGMYKRCSKESITEVEDLRRTVQSLLNKVCPENVNSIVEKFAAVQVREAEELEIVIELIFKKALAEPHYCETYADLVFSLKSVFPEFPSRDGGKPMTFKSSVLNICQNEFEELLATPEPSQADVTLCADEVDQQRKLRKDRMKANMRFVGHLFLRQLLSVKVIGSVSSELVLCEGQQGVDADADGLKAPEEHAIECACELLMSIGYTLEKLPVGQQVLKQVWGRLLELKGLKTADGKGRYSKRVQFMIQDLLETRSRGWETKSFKGKAKTMEEIRAEQERELSSKHRGISSPDLAEHVIVGQRPGYLSTE